MSVGALDEAVRAAEAFDEAARRSLRRRSERSATELLPSHVIELARAKPISRARALVVLTRKALSVRELRLHLREEALTARRRASSRPPPASN
jgi:hypothetical protein